MAYTITDRCVACDACRPQCPKAAIQADVTGVFPKPIWHYSIQPEACNNCFGFAASPQCVTACPVEGGVVPLIANEDDYWAQWFTTYHRLIRQLQHSPA